MARCYPFNDGDRCCLRTPAGLLQLSWGEARTLLWELAAVLENRHAPGPAPGTLIHTKG